MNRLPEAVSQQFNQLFAGINHAADDLKLETAEASMNGNFAQVASNMEHCQNLLALELDIKACLRQFENGSSAVAKDKQRSHHGQRRAAEPSQGIRVRFDGKVIQERNMTSTFVETLKTLGLERVARLNKTITSIPLVSRQQTRSYQRQHRFNGWYITTHINKQSAPALLKEIAKELNVPMQIEFIGR